MKDGWKLYLSGLLLLAVNCTGIAAPPAAAGTSEALKVDTPNELTPMTVNAKLTQAGSEPGSTVGVLFLVRLLPGWHTYAYVPPGEPYVQTRWSLEPGPGLSAQGEWIAPPSVPDPENPRMKLYLSGAAPLTFMHPLKVADNATGEIAVRAGVLFQACNIQRCLPPTRQTFDLKLTVLPASSKSTRSPGAIS